MWSKLLEKARSLLEIVQRLVDKFPFTTPSSPLIRPQLDTIDQQCAIVIFFFDKQFASSRTTSFTNVEHKNLRTRGLTRAQFSSSPSGATNDPHLFLPNKARHQLPFFLQLALLHLNQNALHPKQQSRFPKAQPFAMITGMRVQKRSRAQHHRRSPSLELRLLPEDVRDYQLGPSAHPLRESPLQPWGVAHHRLLLPLVRFCILLLTSVALLRIQRHLVLELYRHHAR